MSPYGCLRIMFVKKEALCWPHGKNGSDLDNPNTSSVLGTVPSILVKVAH